MVGEHSSSRRARATVPAEAGLPVAGLRRRLLAWYRRAGRDLPWRRTRDPYAVWVSEAMLQQTQVATALPYYRRFLERFPTLVSLARAGEADVLHAWAGLGYYRRARALREAARTVVREHGGRVPDDPVAFALLPGVGRYTCAAVLSIVYDRPLAVLDGNVARVLARLTARPLAVRSSRDARALWAMAQTLVPMRDPGDWNQAMMELGARVCVPRSPRCGECPVRGLCQAYALRTPEAFPKLAARRAPVRERWAMALIARRGRVLVARRDGALLAGLWEPPGVMLERGLDATAALDSALRALGVRARLQPLGRMVRHTITHRALEVTLWRGELSAAVPRLARLRWVDPAAPAVALTALGVKAMRAAGGG